MKQNKIPRNEYIIKPKGKTNPYKHDVVYTNLGQWKYPGQVTKIPSNQITMQGVDYPVQGVDDTGYSQMMYPGMDYTFPGQYVTEYPMAQNGAQVKKKDYDMLGYATHHPIGALKHFINPNKYHATDEYKNPNHMTFSDESKYSSPEHQGGHWEEQGNGKWSFTPTDWNIQNAGGIENLQKWWDEGEGKNGHTLIIPKQSYGGSSDMYPFGGIHTKTDTHMATGGWLDSYKDGGDNENSVINMLSKNTLAKGERSNQDNTRVSKAPIKTLQALQAQAQAEKAARYQATEQPVLSQGKKLNPSEQAYSDKVQARIANPSNDLGIIAANMASALTRFRYLNPEEIAATTNNPSATAGLASNIMTEALANEMAGPALGKAFSSGAKNLAKKKLEKQAINNFQPQNLDIPPPPSYEQYAASNLDPVSQRVWQPDINSPYLWSNFETLPNKPVNRSGLTKEEALERFAGTDKEAISKMSEKDFKESVMKPTGEIVPYKLGPEVNQMAYNTDLRNMQLKDAIPMSNEEYRNMFNERLDLLNDIIAKNNKSGVNYTSKGLNEYNQLVFETPEQLVKKQLTEKQIANIEKFNKNPKETLIELGNFRKGKNGKWESDIDYETFDNMEDAVTHYTPLLHAEIGPQTIKGTSIWDIGINPGQWRGDIEDIANGEYYKSIPGLDMRNTSSSVFADRIPRRGTGTYESINEYLKGLDLGRVKPGFNSQSDFSKGLWENNIKKGKAFGFYNDPNTVYGAMKSALPYVGTGALGAAALQQEKLGGLLDEEFRRGGQKGLKKYTSKNIQSSVNDIMLRNETLFGPAGKKRYKPNLKYKDGGWLDNMY